MKLLHSRAAPNNALIQQFNAAYWIWIAGSSSSNVPSGDWAFRTSYVPRAGVISANFLITSDDYFTLYANGQQIGTTRTPANDGKTVWQTTQGYSTQLNTGSGAPVVFAVRVTNASGGAGLIATIQINLADGSTDTISTGTASWRATQNIPQNFQAPNLDDSGWSSTSIIEKNGASAPYGFLLLPSDLTSVTLAAPTSPPPVVATTNPPSPQTTSPSVGTTTIIITSGGATITSISTSASASTSLSVSNGLHSSTTFIPTLIPTSQSTKSSSTLAVGAGAASTTPSAQSKTPVAAIAGGTAGGVVLLLLLLGFLLCYWKRKREAAVAYDHPEIRTAATIAPSPYFAPSPSTATVPSSTQPDGSRQLEPFMLQTPRHDGLRSKSHYGYNTKAGAGGEAWGGVRHSEHERTLSNTSSGTGTRTGEVDVSMNRLQALAEDLNRGLAGRGPNAPRLMVVSNGRDSEWAGDNLANANRDSIPLPPYEKRQGS